MLKTNMNKNLNNAKKAKNDEFYTRYNDVATEVSKYKSQLKGKRILCNCDWRPEVDDYYVYKEPDKDYFAEKLGKEIDVDKTTVLANKSGKLATKDLNYMNFAEYCNALVYMGEADSVSISGYNPATKEGLKFQDVDYSKYDVVITNPPFSLFREFIQTMVDNDMKFLILGNMNALTYKETFKLIKEDKVWLGYGFNLSMIYKAPYKNTSESNRKYVKSKGLNPDENWITVPAIAWFTNLETTVRNDKMILVENYYDEETGLPREDVFPKYDNYDAINVDRLKDLPSDYDGVMGVPITFLGNYNHEQFEIVRFRKGNDGKDLSIKGRRLYNRILIKKTNI